MDDTGNIIDHVVEIFGTEKEAETEEEVVVKHSEALAALQSITSILYEEQEENAETRLMSD